MRHVHQPVDEEIRSIGGYYKVLEEGVLDFEGKKVLFIVKGAHVETSCCGAGGLAYISVPGYLASWKSGKNEDGLDVSEVERVKDEVTRGRIKDILAERYSYVSVIDFD